MHCSDRVLQIISSMNLAEKVGQVFIFTWKNEQQAINDLKFHPGGYVRIYSDAFSVTRQTRQIQQMAALPLFIAADLERGIGGTINGAVETVTCMALGATGDETAAYDAAHIIGEEAAAMGINMNYAPVVDVNNNPSNPVINTRSFGADPALVSRLGCAFAKGLQDAGIAACGKHFPGHGNTNIDSHSLLGSVDSNREELDRVELRPFKDLIASGIDAIMSAHLLIPALEPNRLPATLSPRIMTDLLRNELGFTGVAVSDAMDMKAVAANFPPEKAIPMAVNAGCDQLIMPEDSERAVSILLAAVQKGEVSETRLNEAIARILTLKEKYGILDSALPSIENLHKCIRTPEHSARAGEIAAQSITLVKGGEFLPLQPHQQVCCVNITNSSDSRGVFLEAPAFCDYLSANGLKVSAFNMHTSVAPAPELDGHLVDCIEAADCIIIASYITVQLYSGSIAIPENVLQELRTLLEAGKPVILASFGSPYTVSQLPEVSTYLCAYGATQPSQQAMADAITGRIGCSGKLPVSLD